MSEILLSTQAQKKEEIFKDSAAFSRLDCIMFCVGITVHLGLFRLLLSPRVTVLEDTVGQEVFFGGQLDRRAGCSLEREENMGDRSWSVWRGASGG